MDFEACSKMSKQKQFWESQLNSLSFRNAFWMIFGLILTPFWGTFWMTFRTMRKARFRWPFHAKWLFLEAANSEKRASNRSGFLAAFRNLLFDENGGQRCPPGGSWTPNWRSQGWKKDERKSKKKESGKNRKKRDPAARPYFFWTKTSKCGDLGEDFRRGEIAWFKSRGLLWCGSSTPWPSLREGRQTER